MDEKAFVAYLKQEFPFDHGTGIGDDASVVKQKDHYQLITVDVLIENVHFRRCDFTMAELAEKSLAVNLSDIAAMGGTPSDCYLGLGFPAALGETALHDFFRGIKRGCRKWSVALAGGDYSGAEQLFISITVVGVSKHPVYRSGARVGDLIAVSGPVGASALGLKCLLHDINDLYFIKRHKTVYPQLHAGKLLADYASAMIDVSDGLALDMSRILHASGVGAVLNYERIPVSPRFRSRCQAYGFSQTELVLGGGEDYVLLFTISPAAEKRLHRSKLDYWIIGTVTDTGFLQVMQHGQVVPYQHAGYDHFAARPAKS